MLHIAQRPGQKTPAILFVLRFFFVIDTERNLVHATRFKASQTNSSRQTHESLQSLAADDRVLVHIYFDPEKFLSRINHTRRFD